MRAALLALLLAGCGPAVLGIEVELVTKACAGAVTDTNPLTGVSELRFRLTGDGLGAQVVTADLLRGSAQIPNVPVGTGRRLTVEALVGSRVRARADSGKFDALGPADVHVRLFLRNVDAFTGTGDTGCTRMTAPRAGHAMALLPDGRVLVSGGYSFDGSTPPRLIYRDDAEIFDPATGAFVSLSPGPVERRAGHAALQVAGGILIAGGEGPADASGNGAVAAIRPFELFAKGVWTELSPAGGSPSRSHAASAVDLKTGAALIAGGQAGPDKPGVSVFQTVTWFDPATNALKDAATPLRVGPLTDAVAVARANLSDKTPLGGIVLVGGRDQGGAVLAQVSGLIWGPSAGGLDFVDDATFKSSVFKLPTPRAHHVALRTVDDMVLTAGGVTALTPGAFDYSNATAAITLVDPAGGQVADLPATLSQARADACAVLLDDGAALVAGGAWKDAVGAIHSARSVDLIFPDHSVHTAFGPPNGSGDGLLQWARHHAACLKLRDGSVLISGGLQYPAAGGQPVVLDSAEIYMPAN